MAGKKKATKKKPQGEWTLADRVREAEREAAQKIAEVGAAARSKIKKMVAGSRKKKPARRKA